MAIFRTALALISICILLSLSGLVDCRVPFQREVGENEQSNHLLLPSENEEFNAIARETQTFSTPLEKTDLRPNDEIFQGEKSRGFRFGRPGGCHHGKFNRRGQRKIKNMLILVEFLDLQADSRDFHPRIDRSLPKQREFERSFSKGGWRHPEEGKRGREDEHTPSPARGGWLEFLLRPFLRHDDPTEFHPREDEFRPLPREPEFGHGFPRMDEFHPRVGEFRPQSGHGFPSEDKFHPGVDEFRPNEFHPREDESRPLPRKPEFGHGFQRMDEFHPRVGEFRPESGHGFPGEPKLHPGVDEFRAEFDHGFSTEFDHGFPSGKGTWDTKHWKKQEVSFPQAPPVQRESEEFHSRAEELTPLPHEAEYEHGFPGREGTEPRHGHGNGHGEEEEDVKNMPSPTEIVADTFPAQVESTEFHSIVNEFSPEEIVRADLQA